MWFAAMSIPKFVAAGEQMKATVLGTRHVFCERADKRLMCPPCYYAGFGDFYRYREIDAVMIHDQDGAFLVVNEFSPRIAEFRQSPLYRHFANKNATREPSREERDEEAFILDSDVDRRDEQKVLDALREKYPKVRFLRLVDMQAAGGVLALRKRPDST